MALEKYLQHRHAAPVYVEQVCELGGGASGAAALKSFGYGRPLRITYRVVPGGEGDHAAEPQRVVLRQIKRNGFGRERPADRIAEMWLDWTTFNIVPRHVHAQNIVALHKDGMLQSAVGGADLLLYPDLAPRCDVLEGPAADAIVRVAAMRHADLIVLGMRDKQALRRGRGSVSRRVIDHAPVLVAAQDSPTPALRDRARAA